MTAAVSSTPAATVEVVRTQERLRAIRDSWQQLPQSQQSPLLDHVWMCAAAEGLHGSDELHTMLLYRDTDLVAVAPLTVVHQRGVARLHLLGVSLLHEPTGVLYTSESALRELLDALLELGKPITLQRVESESAAVRLFLERAIGKGRAFIRPAMAAPYVEIATDWQTYLTALSSRRRYDYRRNRKRLQAAGDVLVTHHSVSPELVPALFARFVAVEAAGWKSVNGSSISVKPALREFFAAAAAGWSQAGSLRISFLQLQGQDIAAVLWLVHANRAWVLKIGYDERWSEASPGVQLIWDVLQNAFEARLSSFEFLGNDEPWLSIWTTTKRDYQTLVFYPYTASGWLALGADGLAAIGRRVVRVVRKR